MRDLGGPIKISIYLDNIVLYFLCNVYTCRSFVGWTSMHTLWTSFRPCGLNYTRTLNNFEACVSAARLNHSHAWRVCVLIGRFNITVAACESVGVECACRRVFSGARFLVCASRAHFKALLPSPSLRRAVCSCIRRPGPAWKRCRAPVFGLAVLCLNAVGST